MKGQHAFAIGLGMLLGVFAAPAGLAQESPNKVKGEVTQVMQHVRDSDGGTLDAVMVRTRQGEQHRLLLGESGSCDGCVQVGDRVQMRLMDGGSSGEAHQVCSMRVKRTGESIQFRDDNGSLVGAQSRVQLRDGSGGGSGQQHQHRGNPVGSGGGHRGR
jgi:hypothetical protein